jgi:hypothetical protein
VSALFASEQRSSVTDIEQALFGDVTQAYLPLVNGLRVAASALQLHSALWSFWPTFWAADAVTLKDRL